jgi:uncharacterized protein
MKMEKKFRILAAADLHGDIGIARRLSEKGKKEKVDLVVLAGDINGAIEGDGKILQPFLDAKQKIAFVPGNWDSHKERMAIKSLAKNLGNYYITYGDVGILGTDFDGNLSYNDLVSLKNNFNKMKSKKKILVSHWHARGTLAEFSGWRGDLVLRRAVEEFKPDFLISAHIHEAEGIEDKIGNTRIIQVGRRGTIIEV